VEKWLLTDGHAKSVDTPDKDGQTPLLMAAMEGRVSSLKLLLTKARPGAVDAPNIHKETPLLLAAQEGRSDVVKVLLTECRSAAINIPAADGRTPLISAARFGHLEVCRLLLANGADRKAVVKGSNFIDSDGTAADVARDQDYTDIVELLEGA